MAQASRQTIYSNEDLNKPITGSKSKTYTNKDLDIQDDFQPDDDFSASAEDDFQPDDVATPQSNMTTPINENEPDTWKEGFINSIMGGDALDAGLAGAKGFLKGATLDIPESIVGAVKGAYNLVTNPSETIGAIPEGLRAMWELTKQAGARPEEFGRMMGQTTGQPLTTAGLVKAAPSITRGAGTVAETTGRVMRKHAPVSGMIPRLMEPRLARTMERGIGKGIENIGQRMRQVGRGENPANVPLAQQVLDEGAPEVQLSQTPSKVTPNVPDPNNPQGLVTSPKRRKYAEYGFIEPIDDAVMSPQAIQAMEQVRPTKPAVRLNPDGSYTRFDTGEVVDSTGKPMAAPTPTTTPGVPKELTIRNAPPNQRAKILRGQHDAVDILFENPVDRRVFGAGQNLFNRSTGQVNSGLMQTFQDITNTVAKEYGLPIEKARELVINYNRRLRELSKDMPKYGEDLNFKAPSFETFMDSALRGKQKTHPMDIVKGDKGSVTIKNPVLKQLGSNKEIMPRDIFDKLISEGWTVKGATLDQAWPPGNPKHPSVRVVQLSGSEKRPMIFEPPKPKP